MRLFSNHFVLTGILIIYALLHVLYSWATPPYEASDEVNHYPMVYYLSENSLQLPPMSADEVGAWRQQGAQPPLYHMLSALIIAPLDLPDLMDTWRLNPHSDVGQSPPDGNVNMISHNADAENFPFDNNILAVYILRFFSFLLSCGVIVVTYLSAKELFPDQPIIWITSAGLTAFLPMFAFVGATVNNDNLSNLLGNLLVLLLIRLWKRDSLPHWKDYALIGVVVGCGILSKLSIGLLIPLVIIILLTLSIRMKTWRPLVIGGAISGGLTIVIAGWWYWRNYDLYDDPTGLRIFLDTAGRRIVPADFAQIWAERTSFLKTWWGNFGAVNIPLDDPTYLVFNVIGGLALLSAVLFLTVRIARRDWDWQQWGSVVITLLWIIIAFAGYTRWTSMTMASQGRLLFVMISYVSIWMAVGLTWFFAQRWRWLVSSPVVSFFLIIAVSAPFTTIHPAYTSTDMITMQTPDTLFSDANGNGVIGVWDASVETETVQPSDYVIVNVNLGLFAETDRNWSLFVHLLASDDVLLAQRDVYPGQGLFLTSELDIGDAWENQIAIRIPPYTYAPSELLIRLGWYHLPTGERLQLDNQAEMLTIGTVQLEPRPDSSNQDLPNPLRLQFNDSIELLGYDVSDLSVEQGATIDFTLFWQGLEAIDTDYVVFAQIVDLNTQTRYAGSDSMPANWTRPTSTWEIGELIEDYHELRVSEDAPSGVYALIMGMYQNQDGVISRSSISGSSWDFVHLTNIRIIEADD